MMTKGKNSKSKGSSWKSFSAKQPYGGSPYGYPMYSAPLYQMMAQNPYAAMVSNLYGSTAPNQQFPMAFNPYYMQQDATGAGGVTPADFIKNLIASHIAAQQAKQAAKPQPMKATAATPPSPEQISALINAFNQFVANRKATEAASKPGSPAVQSGASTAATSTGPPTADQISALLEKLREIITIHKEAEAKNKSPKVKATDTFTENSGNEKPSGSVKRELSSRKSNDAVGSTFAGKPIKPPNPAWPAIEKQLKALGIPIAVPGTTPSPEDLLKLKTKFLPPFLPGSGIPFWAGFIKPKTSSPASSVQTAKPNPWAEFMKKYLTTSSDPAMTAGYPSPWSAIAKQLISAGIPVSPAATLPPEAWLKMKASFMMPPSSGSPPFWAAFIKPKFSGVAASMSDPPASGSSSSSPFWASYIPSKTGFAPLKSAFIPAEVSSFIPPKGAFIPKQVSAFIPPKGAFIPPAAAAFIPKGFGSGPAQWSAYMSDPPASGATNPVPPFWAAFLTPKAAFAPPKSSFLPPPAVITPPNPWLEFLKPYMSSKSSSSSGTQPKAGPVPPFWAALMKPRIPEPTPTPKPNPWAEYYKSLFNFTGGARPATGGTVPFWAAFVKPKPPKPVKPNPWAELMKSYMAASGKPSKTTAPASNVAGNPWLEFMEAMSKSTKQKGAQPSTQSPQASSKEIPQVATLPSQEMTDLWAEFMKSYMGTGKAASGTNPNTPLADPVATIPFANPYMPGGVPPLTPSAWLALKQKLMTSAVPGAGANPVGPFSGPADWLNIKDAMVKAFSVPGAYTFNIPASDPNARGQAS